MHALGVFGINNSNVNTAVSVALLILARALSGARSSGRSRTPAGGSTTRCSSLCATACSLFPFVGTIVYLIVRPPEFLDDVRLRELEMTAAEARLAIAGLPAVPALRLRDQGGLPALSELHAQAEGALLLVRQADRPGVAHVPVLRGRDERARRRPRRAAGAAQTTDQPTVAHAEPDGHVGAEAEPAEAGDGRVVASQASLTHSAAPWNEH